MDRRDCAWQRRNQVPGLLVAWFSGVGAAFDLIRELCIWQQGLPLTPVKKWRNSGIQWENMKIVWVWLPSGNGDFPCQLCFSCARTSTWRIAPLSHWLVSLVRTSPHSVDYTIWKWVITPVTNQLQVWPFTVTTGTTGTSFEWHTLWIQTLSEKVLYPPNHTPNTS